jgi:hypothetical protein
LILYHPHPDKRKHIRAQPPPSPLQSLRKQQLKGQRRVSIQKHEVTRQQFSLKSKLHHSGSKNNKEKEISNSPKNNSK